MTKPTVHLFKVIARLAKGMIDAFDKWLDEQAPRDEDCRGKG